MKKKVAIITEAAGGGVRKHILDLLFNLDNNKYELYFLYSLNRADKTMIEGLRVLKKKNVNLIELKMMYREINIKNDLNAFIELKGILKSISPDIVHCHSSKAGAIGRLCAKVIGVKQIYYTPHAYIMQNPNISNIKKKMYFAIESLLSKFFTTQNINVSYGEKEFAINHKLDKENKFTVIYNGIDVNFENYDILSLKKELDISDTDIVLGVTARMDEQKDPFTFIKIAEKTIKQYNNVKFIYVGDGIYKNEIQKYINEKKLTNNIKLLGFRKDINKLLYIFDIYLITSLYEGMPYSLIEALKYNLPIVATNTIGNNEVVNNSSNGFLFEVKNYNDGFEKVSNLINDKDLRKRMSKNSYEIFEKKFTLENMICNIEKLYDNVVI